ncbi:MAG: 2-C-methyl-D-erythritol 4-phosphate cytidylyltransferase [Vagococcus sp.]|nr:2-C-methyl-D-erythritol 4-phosphate cytidylyltransferase [Vagococcus sp.]
MIFGAILAGGTGSRMNIENMPKQFLPLGTKPVFVHTVEKFLAISDFDLIYIGVHPQWTAFAQDILHQHGICDGVEILEGGEDRNATIMNIVAHIRSNHGVDAKHVVVTHDSVRPFVRLTTIKDNIVMAQKYGACDTVVPAIDTIVASEDGKQVSDIPKREYMHQGQTPQSFNVEKLYHAYQNLSEDDLSTLTDACKIMLLQGEPVYLVSGDVTNIKLTTIMDYKIAQALIDTPEKETPKGKSSHAQ